MEPLIGILSMKDDRPEGVLGCLNVPFGSGRPSSRVCGELEGVRSRHMRSMHRIADWDLCMRLTR